MNLTRREFVRESLATLGFLALPGGLFAAPAGWKPKKKPNLVVGVMSDTHLMVGWNGRSPHKGFPLTYVRNAFELFKARGVDAVVHCGDAAHRGAVREWEFHKEVFEDVFGKRGTGNRERGTGKHPFSREGLLKVIGSPEFGKKAKLVVEKGTQATKATKGAKNGDSVASVASLKIKIPLADGNPDSRVFAYDVVVVGEAGAAADGTESGPPKLFKSVYFEGCNVAPGHEPNNGFTEVEIPVSELPAGKKLTIAVRPVSSLGTKGKAIAATIRV